MELGDDGNGQVLQETKQASACKSCFPQWQDTDTVSWSPDSTAQETVQTRNPSEIVPFKDLKGQCNLLSGYLNESWQLQVNRCLKLSAWFPSSLPSPRHPPKGAAFVHWLLKALCEHGPEQDSNIRPLTAALPFSKAHNSSDSFPS